MIKFNKIQRPVPSRKHVWYLAIQTDINYHISNLEKDYNIVRTIRCIKTPDEEYKVIVQFKLLRDNYTNSIKLESLFKFTVSQCIDYAINFMARNR